MELLTPFVIGIEVPKYRPVSEYFGQESDYKNAEYVFAKQITLIPDGQDKDGSGRLLRYVKIGEIFVNYQLVAQGYALALADPSSCLQVLKSAEQSASKSRIGLWNPTSTPPAP
jgi:micrococcal nuclease